MAGYFRVLHGDSAWTVTFSSVPVKGGRRLVGRRHRSAPVFTDVECVVCRKVDRDYLVYSALGDIVAVDRQRAGSALSRLRRRRLGGVDRCDIEPYVQLALDLCETDVDGQCKGKGQFCSLRFESPVVPIPSRLARNRFACRCPGSHLLTRNGGGGTQLSTIS
jgi:hypothetical protein